MLNQPSDRRLHPVSFLFQLASHIRSFLLPGLFVLLAGARGGETWQLGVMVLFLPLALVSIARTLVFRYRMDPEELVIQSGLLFRHQRHVPYERVQNIDAVQNVVHRALRVVEVRLETAGGQEPEAHLSVVSLAAFEELRACVQTARARGGVVDAGAGEVEGAAAEPSLLQLSPRELVICGLIQGRGLIVLGALFGLLWEVGLMDRVTTAFFGEQAEGRGVVREFMGALFGQAGLPLGRIGMTALAFAAFLVITRVFSVGWSLVRLYGFTLRRTGDDLRADFGLFTRVAATIPIRRIQSVTVHEGPLHRLFGRVSVRVDTAGGDSDRSVQLQRQWLAPVIPPGAVPHLLREVLPSVDAAAFEWQPVEPRGVRRARLRWLVSASLISLALVFLLRWHTVAVFLAIALLGEIDARRSVSALGWGATDSGVIFRSGWLWRRQTIAPVAKIQTVSVQESPFDRRLGMASVEVDTAGTAQNGHRIDVPYLSRATADALAARLAAQAAQTAFRW